MGILDLDVIKEFIRLCEMDGNWDIMNIMEEM